MGPIRVGQVQNHTEDDVDDWITETVGLKTDKFRMVMASRLDGA